MKIKALNFCVRMRMGIARSAPLGWMQQVLECSLSDLMVVVWAARGCRGLVPYTFGRIIMHSLCALRWPVELLGC